MSIYTNGISFKAHKHKTIAKYKILADYSDNIVPYFIYKSKYLKYKGKDLRPFDFHILSIGFAFYFSKDCSCSDFIYP